MSFYGIEDVMIPTSAFQKAAKDILATYGTGRVINPALQGFSDAPKPPPVAGALAGGGLVVAAALSGLVAVYIFRHVNDEKQTFWKVIGYVGGISGVLSALTLLMSSVAAVTVSLPATTTPTPQPIPQAG